jgi:hypothetical protein
LLRADGVRHEAISCPLWQQTRQQLEREAGVLLLVHDDTELDYGYRPATRDLGPISWGGLHLLPPEKGPYAGNEPLPLWVVRVWEPEPPAKQQAQRAFVPSQKHGQSKRQQPQSQQVEALEWILLSALPVETSQQAWHMIRYYQSRWPIEDFHRGMKTGCRLEQRHLQEQRSLENLLAIVSPIAVRLLQLRNQGREEPQQPALAWVEPEEAHVIACREG